MQVVTTGRGCGKSREAGGMYLVVPSSEHGIPINSFIPCPLKELKMADQLSPQGLNFITDTEGVTHIFDWVGEVHYPTPYHYWVETGYKGLSRRINPSATEQFKKLSNGSLYYLVHPLAKLEDDEFGIIAGFMMDVAPEDEDCSGNGEYMPIASVAKNSMFYPPHQLNDLNCHCYTVHQYAAGEVASDGVKIGEWQTIRIGDMPHSVRTPPPSFERRGMPGVILVIPATYLGIHVVDDGSTADTSAQALAEALMESTLDGVTVEVVPE